MKSWFKHYILDIVYVWVGMICAFSYMFGGGVGYLIAALVAPITQHFYDLHKG